MRLVLLGLLVLVVASVAIADVLSYYDGKAYSALPSNEQLAYVAGVLDTLLATNPNLPSAIDGNPATRLALYQRVRGCLEQKKIPLSGVRSLINDYLRRTPSTQTIVMPDNTILALAGLCP